jgi:hypothetical protein
MWSSEGLTLTIGPEDVSLGPSVRYMFQTILFVHFLNLPVEPSSLKYLVIELVPEARDFSDWTISYKEVANSLRTILKLLPVLGQETLPEGGMLCDKII